MKEFFGLIPFVKIPEASIHHFKEGCDAAAWECQSHGAPLSILLKEASDWSEGLGDERWESWRAPELFPKPKLSPG